MDIGFLSYVLRQIPIVMKYYLPIMLFFCINSLCFAQKHTVEFLLKDETAQPIENAVCKFIKDPNTIEAISYTDSLGFSSTEIQHGIYQLSISMFGHLLY